MGSKTIETHHQCNPEGYPQIEITIRADAGYNSQGIYQLARKKKANYCIAIAKNRTLMESIESTSSDVYYEYMLRREKTEVVEFDYQAKAWSSKEKVVSKIESTGKGFDIRFLVTNLKGEPRDIYDDFYVKRGGGGGIPMKIESKKSKTCVLPIDCPIINSRQIAFDYCSVP